MIFKDFILTVTDNWWGFEVIPKHFGSDNKHTKKLNMSHLTYMNINVNKNLARVFKQQQQQQKNDNKIWTFQNHIYCTTIKDIIAT